MKFLMPFMITQINNEIDLLTHLREYERIANGKDGETQPIVTGKQKFHLLDRQDL